LAFIRVVFVGLPGKAWVFGSNGRRESGILGSKRSDLFPDFLALLLQFTFPEVPALSVPSQPGVIAGGIV